MVTVGHCLRRGFGSLFRGGAGWVVFAAFLWATDALIRYPALHHPRHEAIEPFWIVWVEHSLAVLLFFPWVVWRYPHVWHQLSRLEWLAALFSGLGGSALATVLFTSSFLYTNPSVALLLQKLQPFLVLGLAWFVLKEKWPSRAWIAALVAFVAAFWMSFPEGFESFGVSSSRQESSHFWGVMLALGAAFFWAAATVSGRFLLGRVPPLLATFWRFFFGWWGLLGILAVAQLTPPSTLPFAVFQWHTLKHWETLGVILYLSFIPGIFALLLYYHGLARTPASVTAFIELLYPLFGVLLNTLILGTPFSWTQGVATCFLVAAVGWISFRGQSFKD